MENCEKVVDIMQNTLDCVDSRLINHGKRVSYLVFKILQLQNKYTKKQVRDICILAMLHDIGAYKTEEIEKMVIFETVNVWEHSIYGYLFLKYFSPLKELAPIIFCHHANCRDLQYIDSSYHELAQIISLCDRADIFSQTSGHDMSKFKKSIEKFRDIKFRSDIIDLFFSANIKFDLFDENLEGDENFIDALYGIDLSEQEADNYIKMIILSIEFRSHQTVIHTIATACVARTIAALLGRSEKDTAQITIGAMLHDIGKTGIPIEILENPNRLSETEMEIMKSHVDITEKIITGNVTDEVKHIAVRHHEKLNGAGYPKGLNGADLSLNERIIAISDIFSALCGVRSYKNAYPKEKAVRILDDMSTRGFIDADIVRLSIMNFDLIMDNLQQECEPIIEMYDNMNKEYEQLMESIKYIKDNADIKSFFIHV